MALCIGLRSIISNVRNNKNKVLKNCQVKYLTAAIRFRLAVVRISFRADTINPSSIVWTPLRYVTLHFRERPRGEGYSLI